MKTRNMLAGLLVIWILAPMTLTHAATMSELESANKLAGMGVINSGSNAADFGLSQTITRKEMMKVVMNLSGKSVPDSCNWDFSDVTNDWGCKYIEAGLANGLIAGNATFRPDDTISKAEAMKLVLGARGIKKAYNTSDWQADWMNTALDNGLIVSAYSNHNAAALRGFIFSVGAAESKVMMDKKMDDTMMKGGDVMMDNAMVGYKDYSESLLGKNDTTVLFFHASWCPSCKALDANLLESGVDNILLLKTDYDSQTALRQKYWVTTQHTFVQVDADGKQIAKWTGSSNIQDILDKVQ